MRGSTVSDSDTSRAKSLPEGAIPPQIAERLRALLHDLGNALEIVLQAEYLLSTATELPPEAKEWLGLLRKGTQQATKLNQTLREEVRKHG
jgi:hypothetical protein